MVLQKPSRIPSARSGRRSVRSLAILAGTAAAVVYFHAAERLEDLGPPGLSQFFRSEGSIASKSVAAGLLVGLAAWVAGTGLRWLWRGLAAMIKAMRKS